MNANAEYQQRYRETAQAYLAEHPQPVGGEPDYYQEILEVTCWCEEQVVRVPREMLHQGMTHPCKRKECVRIAESKGWRKPVRKGQDNAKVARSLVTKMAVQEMRG